MNRHGRLDASLEALLEAARPTEPAHPPASADGGRADALVTTEVAVDELVPGRYQPRQRACEGSLAELADSIREQGVLQPLVVRTVPAVRSGSIADSADASHAGGSAARYEIVAGERRWRAAILAGLAAVPVIVRELDDQSALAVALIENLQREDLNPIDQARSLSRLADEFALTHEQVAKAIGRSRASVSNLLRLLDLTDEVKELLANGGIDMGHARALLPLDPERQVAMARRTEKRSLSVRQVEKAVRTLLCAPPEGANADVPVDLQTRWLQQQIARELGTQFAIRSDKNGGYTLQVGFGDLEQLQDTLQRIQELLGMIRETAGPRAGQKRIPTPPT